MAQDLIIERLFEVLTDGDRHAAARIVNEQFDAGASAQAVLTDLFWPTYELIDRLHREDSLSDLSHGLAVRLLRVLVDRAGTRLDRTSDGNARRVLAFCGAEEAEELGAQIAVDILDAHGFDVRFVGGGVANDEILNAIHRTRPDVLLSFCSSAADLPNLRGLIDTMHEIGACPKIQIVVGGGVFNRAEGLAEEMGADLWAVDPIELAEAMILDAGQRAKPEQKTVGRVRRSRAAA